MPPHSYNRHGNHQEVQVGEFTRDRTGVVTGIVERHLAEDSAEKIAWKDLHKRAAPQQSGVPCVNVSRIWREGYGIYKYSYEGFDNDFEPDDEDCTIELDISLSESAIETHVNFAELRDRYSWISSKRQFAQYLAGADTYSKSVTAGTADPLIALAGGKTTQTLNPLFATETYLEVGAHYRITYARRELPASSVALTNCIVKSPTGLELFKLPAWAAKRNWLCLGPRLVHRGNVFQIVEEYLLSGPRGWLKQIYGADKMGASSTANLSSGPGSGQQIGSLQ